jgi:UDP:flavonoid glycosyltransferase YjiC (YdhE family)
VTPGSRHAGHAQPLGRELRGVACEVTTRLGVYELIAGYPHDPPVVRIPVSLLEDDVDGERFGHPTHDARPSSPPELGSAAVRILFAFTGTSGHLDPLVPIARAAQAVGHTIAFAGRPSMVRSVEALGFRIFATETGRTEPPPERLPLLALDAEREDSVVREGFAGRIARQRARDVGGFCVDWHPDVLVCDEVDFGSMVAAEKLGLPYASVVVIGAGSFVRPDLVAEPLHALRLEHGLPVDPELAMLSRYLVLSPFPPSYRDPGFPLPATGHSFGPLPADGSPVEAETIPPWLARATGPPTVYFTLGTVFNLESGDLLERVLAGLGDLPVKVVAAVGRQLDAGAFGPQPDNVHLERYLPQALVLPHCAAVVSHGGSGSVLGALAHGLPSVLLPMGADQPLNAARCAALGVSRVLDAMTATPEAIRDAVSAVLSDPTYRSAAERLRAEIDALPGPAHAVTLLERLAAERRPLLNRA